LSKQNNAPSIDIEYPQNALIQALKFLGQDPPGELRHSPVNEVIQWAILHWQRDLIPPKKTIFAPSQSPYKD
jgi:glutamyl-Q tRNA(Asp) synthetase